MSDGKVVIDVKLDDSAVRSDARVIEQLLQGLGGHAGQSMDENFRRNTESMTQRARQTSNEVNNQFRDPINLRVELHDNISGQATNAFRNVSDEADRARGHLDTFKGAFEGTIVASLVEGAVEHVKEGFTELIKTGIEYNATQDKMNATWKTLTGDASKGQNMVDMINNFQRSTGYATETLNEMEQKIYHIKGSASETETMTKAFTTLGDAMGLSDDKLTGVSEQFSQMMATGKAYAGDINVMTNAFPAFGDALQEHFHMGMGQIRQMASNGKLSATDVEETLIEMSHKYKDATENAMSTTQGLWRTMESNFGRLAGAFTKPIFDMKKSGFKDLADWLNSNEATKLFSQMGESTAKFFGKVVDLIDYLAKHRDSVISFAEGVGKVVGAFLLFKGVEGTIGAINAVYKAVKGFYDMMIAEEVVSDALDPMKWIAIAITAVGIACVEAYNHSESFRNFVNTVWKDIQLGWQWITKFGEAIKDLFSGNLTGTVKATSIMEKLGIDSKTQGEITKIVTGIKNAFDGIGGALQGAFKWIGQFGTAIVDMFGGIEKITKGTSIMTKLGLDPAEQKLISKAVGVIKDAFQSFKDTVEKVWNYIEPTLVKGMKTVWTAIQSGLDTVKKYWNQIFPELQPALDGLVKILLWVWHIIFEPMMLGIKIALGALSNSWKAIWDTVCSALKLAWDVIVGAVKVGWDIVSGIFQVIVDLLSGKFSKAWTDMKKSVVTVMSDLWDNLKKVTKDMGDLFVNLGKTIADGLLGGLAAGVNAVGGGINWILDKVHAPDGARIPKWTPPKYAQGTDGHQGGLAIVGDGKKRELIKTPDGQLFLSPNNDTLVNLPKGTNVLDGHNTEKLMNLGLIPRYASGIGGAWDWLKSTASGAVDSLKSVGSNIWNYVSNPQKLIQTAIKNFTNLKGLLDPALSLTEGAIDSTATNAVNWIKGLINGSPDNPANASSIPTGNVSGTLIQWLTQAMQITKTPMAYLGALAQIAMHESGGNPHAINLWDSNAKAGHPSKGLMQTIDSTFNKYAIAGLGDIWNPVSNAVASIRYSDAVYGSIANVPGVKALASGHNYVGYANGTGGSVGGKVVVGENEPELIQTTDGRWVLANQATSFDDFVAGSTVTPLSKMGGILAKAKSVLNHVGNPSISTPLVQASIANGKDTNIQVNIQPIVVQSVLDGRVIAETVTNVQSQNTVRTGRLRGEI